MRQVLICAQGNSNACAEMPKPRLMAGLGPNNDQNLLLRQLDLTL